MTWQELESPVFPGRWVTRITVDPDDPKVAWASFSGWRSGDAYPHVVMTSDGGNTWVDIVGKRVPQAPVNDVIRHPSKPKWLFIATDVGVFRTTNLGKTWIKVGGEPAARADQRHRPARRQRHALRSDLRSQRLDDLAGRRLLNLSAPRPCPPSAGAGGARRSPQRSGRKNSRMSPSSRSGASCGEKWLPRS